MGEEEAQHPHEWQPQTPPQDTVFATIDLAASSGCGAWPRAAGKERVIHTLHHSSIFLISLVVFHFSTSSPSNDDSSAPWIIMLESSAPPDWTEPARPLINRVDGSPPRPRLKERENREISQCQTRGSKEGSSSALVVCRFADAEYIKE